MNAINLEKLLHWEPPQRVETRQGWRNLRKAKLPPLGTPEADRWWTFWRANRAHLSQHGLAVNEWPKESGTWWACWWERVDEKQIEAHIEASAATDSSIEVPTPAGLELFPYQKAGVYFACRVFGLEFEGGRLKADSMAQPKRGCLIGDEPGLGKTLQAIGVINIDARIQRALIVCPATLKYNWHWELKRGLVRPMTVGIAEGKTFPKTDIVILNPDILHNFPKSLSFFWDLVVIDEAHSYCFVAGTKVATKYGLKPIEEISKGEHVLSCALSGKMLEYRHVTATYRTDAYANIVRVHHECGHFDCTSDHEIWTTDESGKEAWKEAGLLSHRDSVWVLQNTGEQRGQGKIYGPILQQLMRLKMENAATGNSEKAARSTGKNGQQNMPMVQKGIHFPQQGRKEEREKEILQPQVPRSSQDERPGISFQVHQGHECRVDRKEARKISSNINADDASQSDAKPSSAGKNGKVAQRKNISSERRKRTGNGATKEVIGGHEMADGSCYLNNPGKRHVPKPAKMLQSGCRERGAENSGRSGWKNAQAEKVEVLGPQKNRNLKRSRVVSVEILKRISNDEPGQSDGEHTIVYCIEVEGNANFFANGTLVSNCNPKARKSKVLFGYKPTRKEAAKGETPSTGIAARRKLALTGTPLVNRVMDLWPVLNYLDPETWNDRWAFGLRYADGHQKKVRNPKTGKKMTIWDFGGSSKLSELQGRLRSSIMIRREKHEVLKDLPPKIYKLVELQGEQTAAAVQEEIAFMEQSHREAAEKIARAATLARGTADLETFKEAADDMEASLSIAFQDMSRVRHKSALAKLPACLEYLQGVFEEDPTHKAIVFCHHLDVIAALRQAFPKAAVVVGGMTAEEKAYQVGRFQSDPEATPFIGGLRAASEGITLTAASHVIFVEQDWTAKTMLQAVDRAHRIGQRNSVLVEVLVAKGSIDCHIAQTWLAKMKIAQDALNRQPKNLL